MNLVQQQHLAGTQRADDGMSERAVRAPRPALRAIRASKNSPAPNALATAATRWRPLGQPQAKAAEAACRAASPTARVAAAPDGSAGFCRSLRARSWPARASQRFRSSKPGARRFEAATSRQPFSQRAAMRSGRSAGTSPRGVELQLTGNGAAERATSSSDRSKPMPAKKPIQARKILRRISRTVSPGAWRSAYRKWPRACSALPSLRVERNCAHAWPP